MALLVVAALVLSVAAVAWTMTVAVVRAVRLFRQAGATGKVLGAEVERVAATANEVTAKAEALGRDAGELESSVARLRASQAQLSVLLGAWSDVRDSIGRVTALVPRK